MMTIRGNQPHGLALIKIDNSYPMTFTTPAGGSTSKRRSPGIVVG